RERRTATPAQRRRAEFRAELDVLRVVVLPADDDLVLDPPGHEQFVAVEKAEIASPKERAFDITTSRAKHLLGVFRTMPIALRHRVPADPNLADPSKRTVDAAFRIDDRDPGIEQRAAAADNRSHVRWQARLVRIRDAMDLQRLGIQIPPDHPAVAPRT